MQIVYILKSLKDGNLYIGCTANVEERVRMHNDGRVQATKSRRPLVVAYKEEYEDRYEAFRMERFYKTANGKRVVRKKLWGVV